jgi:hypothetical protein
MKEEDKDILDIVEEPGPDINEDRLLKTIWLQPRHTIRFILKHCPDKYLWGLLVLGGIAGSLGNLAENGLLMNLTGFVAFIATVALGGIFGPLFNLIFAGLIRMTGRWIKGQADFSQILIVVAWSLVPSIASMVFFLARWVYFGNDIFLGNTDLSSIFNDFFITFTSLADLALSVWSLVILIVGLSEVQHFGIGRAILNLILVFVFIVIVFGVFAFLIGDLLFNAIGF